MESASTTSTTSVASVAFAASAAGPAFGTRDAVDSERRDWLGLLARTPVELIDSAVHSRRMGEVRWLRRPETGLMMMRGRIGGSGGAFNVGELTVTRCALRLADREGKESHSGIGWVLGRSHLHAEKIAMVDALMQFAEHRDFLRECLLDPARRRLDGLRAAQREAAARTKVEFFTVARTVSS